jgi:DNA polymerase-1
VCDHPQRHSIDEALVSGSPYRSVAKRFELSETAVYRHKIEHLPAHLLKAREVEEVAQADDRMLAKAVNFGLLYGMGYKGLQSYALKSSGIEMSLEEAALYRRRFFQTYPGLKRWHDRERRTWQRGETQTRTLTSRRRMDVERLTDRLDAPPVQGSGADGLKLALALLWERRDECPGTVPVLVCHDEIVVECEAEQTADAKAWLEKAMIEGMLAVLNGTGNICVSVEVETRVGRDWGERG